MSIIDERAATYGPVQGGNITRIADLWTAYLGTMVTEHDVAWMMVLLKASRSKQDPSHQDNYVDGLGYLEIAREFS